MTSFIRITTLTSGTRRTGFFPECHMTLTQASSIPKYSFRLALIFTYTNTTYDFSIIFGSAWLCVFLFFEDTYHHCTYMFRIIVIIISLQGLIENSILMCSTYALLTMF